MLPVLVSFGSFRLYTLGLFLAVGFFLYAFIVWRRLVELGFKEEKIIDFIMVGVVSGILVSRLSFIAQNFSKFGFFFERWLFFGRYPGFSFWGGVIGLLLGLIWFIKKEKWNFWQVGDEITFGVVPFLFLIQLGMFFDGSTPGRPTAMPWGMFFPGSLVRQHPVSLYAAIFLLLVWIFLLRIERKWRTWEWYKDKSSGFVVLTFITLLFFLTLLLAFLEGSKLYLFWLEVILSLLGTIGGFVLLWQKGKAKKISLKPTKGK